MKVNKALIKKGCVIAVAVSGGRDSMALLHFLNSEKEKMGISIIAVNIEHGIRGQASKDDTKFVKNKCAELNIECICKKVDTLAYKEENKVTVEQAARVLRYGIFDDLYKKGKFSLLATAHHKDDNAETVLMRIFRGTGLKGLKGIAERRGYIVRPLLEASGSEIEKYIKKNNIEYRIDETNMSSDYARNYIRNEIMPGLEAKFGGVTDNIVRLSKNAGETEDYFNSIIPKFEIDESGAVLVHKFILSEHPAVAKRALMSALTLLNGGADIEERHLDIIINFIASGTGSIDLPGGIKAYNEPHNIAFTSPCVAAKLPKASIKRIKKYDEKKLCIDLDKVPEGSIIRTRAEGDIFTKFGGGTKKLNDYLTDIKYPLRLRDRLQLLASGNVVLAIFEIELSEKVKIDEETKNIGELTLR